jgi:hypothetical protein
MTMLTPNPFADATELELIDGALADIGTIWRRSGEKTLSNADFAELMRRSRQRLLALRDIALTDEPEVELTEAGQAMLTARSIAFNPAMIAALKRLPGIRTARQLLDDSDLDDASGRRPRVVGGLELIQGGLKGERS